MVGMKKEHEKTALVPDELLPSSHVSQEQQG